jgi:hypothetical protein
MLAVQENPYQVLGVSRKASIEAIKAAFHALAKKCHPDRHSEDPGAEQQFKRINEAYGVLKDPQRRAAYDAARPGLFIRAMSAFGSRWARNWAQAAHAATQKSGELEKTMTRFTRGFLNPQELEEHTNTLLRALGSGQVLPQHLFARIQNSYYGTQHLYQSPNLKRALYKMDRKAYVRVMLPFYMKRLKRQFLQVGEMEGYANDLQALVRRGACSAGQILGGLDEQGRAHLFRSPELKNELLQRDPTAYREAMLGFLVRQFNRPYTPRDILDVYATEIAQIMTVECEQISAIAGARAGAELTKETFGALFDLQGNGLDLQNLRRHPPLSRSYDMFHGLQPTIRQPAAAPRRGVFPQATQAGMA